MLFKLGIIAACLGGLAGLWLIKSRLVKASLMAGLSGIMLLLIGMLMNLAQYEQSLLDSIARPDTPYSIGSFYPPDVSAYLVTHYGKHLAYFSGYHFTYWVLFAFLLIAPFVMVWTRKKPI